MAKMAKELDLYDFPSDHVGRRRYVTVRGHSKSVPAYKTYVGTDRRNHLLPEYGGNWDYAAKGSGPMIMADKLAYVSPIDGSHVTSRTAHRDHCIRHNVVECGDMSIGEISRGRDTGTGSAAPDIVRAIETLSS